MMEFLDTLFNYEYFGPILFTIIAILIVVFFIVLFFGKKDEKERILEETRRLELANLNAFKEETEEKQKLEIKDKDDNLTLNDLEKISEKNNNEINVSDEDEKVIVEPVINIDKEEIDIPILSPISDLPLITEREEEYGVPELPEGVEFEIKPNIPENIPKYNFEELANSITRELEEIEKISSLKTKDVEEKEESGLKLEESQIEVTPIKEVKKFKPSPVFSSVFVPQKTEIEEDKKEAIEEEIKPVELPLENKIEKEDVTEKQEVAKSSIDNTLDIIKKVESTLESKSRESKGIDFSVLKTKEQEEIIQPVKPKMALPKQVQLPKKANADKLEINMPSFENIEGETYSLKR